MNKENKTESNLETIVELEIYHQNPRKGEVWIIRDPFSELFTSDMPDIEILILEDPEEDLVKVMSPREGIVETKPLWVFNSQAKRICKNE